MHARRTICPGLIQGVPLPSAEAQPRQILQDSPEGTRILGTAHGPYPTRIGWFRKSCARPHGQLLGSPSSWIALYGIGLASGARKLTQRDRYSAATGDPADGDSAYFSPHRFFGGVAPGNRICLRAGAGLWSQVVPAPHRRAAGLSIDVWVPPRWAVRCWVTWSMTPAWSWRACSRRRQLPT